ncbi:Wzz/FepE/Etk N-terminal domain-containing protein [Pseudochrobactrum sp. sp1633]|uniref:Wzz/FepE/Etk N-terminal domain-containing protein n=1 Tax=Pseudochrobactrum sp. sp1633 TaxID=3036706 RepID=UPI0025A5D176|nr:Wzz/FepE/Etk N-terminal domain-containing protein [Pseudochrobactrum sp. sp1633]MDM8344599.1 Wzz/FepE/Etk N-terminal domain-containing protein [Pseudochrobactrum sp. sp1633]HWD13640.1 Wzz/FepE/Etk N-terminal domain-containing protein [Pseudochrobactrum sp.]
MRGAAENAEIDIGALFASLKRNWLFILLGAVLFSLLVWGVAQVLTPWYRSEARILIEMRESVFTRPNASPEADRPLLDPEAVKSQVELIGSPQILAKVATDLKLADHTEFYRKTMTPVKQVLVMLGLRPDPRTIPVADQVLTRMRENLQVYNVTGSRVIVVEFVSKNPQIAADVANKIADEYIAMQIAAKRQLTGDATGWLEPEIEQLTKKVREAETKVADFRAATDLLNTSGNTSLATQQMSDISSELSRLKAQRAASEAKAESIRTALKNGVPINSLPEVMSSGIMLQLNERRGALMAEIANLSTTLLDGHPRIQGLRAQLADLDRQIRQEGSTILKSLDNEVATARSREQEQSRELNRLKAQAAEAGSQEVELRALEREATAQRELLQTYLARFREASSRADRNNQPADARIFSPATVAGEPYFPKVLPMVSMSFVAGLLLLSVFVLLRELFSGRALIPAKTGRGQNLWGDEYGRSADDFEVVQNKAMLVDNAQTMQQASESVSDNNESNERLMARPEIDVETIQRIYDSYSVSEPEAAGEPDPASDDIYAPNGVAAIASRLMLQERRRIVLISPEGDAGSAGSVHLLRELADRSLRVLLVDMTGNGAVSQAMLDGGKPAGITDLLLNVKQFTDIIHGDLYSDADVIPTGLSDPKDAMAQAERLPVIFEALETAYDFVLVETGATTAEQALNLDSDATLFIMNVSDSEDQAVAQTALAFHEAGQEDVTILMVPHN